MTLIDIDGAQHAIDFFLQKRVMLAGNFFAYVSDIRLGLIVTIVSTFGLAYINLFDQWRDRQRKRESATEHDRLDHVKQERLDDIIVDRARRLAARDDVAQRDAGKLEERA